MDGTQQAIVDFVDRIEVSKLSAAVLHEARRRVVDTIGCALGAMHSPTAQVARSVAAELSSSSPATVIASEHASSVEAAAFANTVMARYLDFNDMYFAAAGGGGHPSDLIATSLAVGEATGATGSDVLLSIVLSYEVLGTLAGMVRLRERGWDQGLYTVVAAAMAAGKLMGLNAEQLGHAVSLAITPNVPTRQTRVGELSMWKGAATAGAARNGIFAAILAGHGMTGPPEPFEGADGIWAQVTGAFHLELPEPGTRPLVIERIHTKYRPAEYNAQGAIDVAVSLRTRFDVDEVERILVETYWLAYSEIGSEPAKWRPQTRETADHSLPYLIATALLDGDVRLDSFTAERLRDPDTLSLMDRIEVVEDDDFTSRFPAELCCRITAHLKDGSTVVEETKFPTGHASNPMTDHQIDEKFEGLVSAYPDHDIERALCVRDAIWELDARAVAAAMMEELRHVGSG